MGTQVVSGLFPWRTKLRLARSLVTKNHPVYVQFYVTARCNLDCEQCNIIYGNSDVSEVTLDGVERIADNLEKIGVSIVLLTGGEPFVRRDLPEIVGAFSARGMHVRIQTNGLAREDAVRACVAAGANDISISLDSIHPGLQDTINGGYDGSWARAVQAFAMVNRVFPSDSFAAMGCVLAPRNIAYVPDVIRFATEIGWFVSLVPAHTTPQHRPQNFRSFDPTCRFAPTLYPPVRQLIDTIRTMRNDGYLLYDSDEYLEDMYRLVCNEPVRWRDRNGGVCDSPNLYFAIQPNGHMAVCCDYRLPAPVSTMAPDFPERFFGDALRKSVYDVAAACDGCLYGSFPEMTITSRFLGPMLKRALFFNAPQQKRLKKLSADEMFAIAERLRAERPDLYPAGRA